MPVIQEAQQEHDRFEAQSMRESYIPSVMAGRYVGGYRVWVRFDDGSEGEIDLSDLTTRAGKFKQLADLTYFGQVFCDETMRTMAWPNGLDLAPESRCLRLKGGYPCA